MSGGSPPVVHPAAVVNPLADMSAPLAHLDEVGDVAQIARLTVPS